MTTNDGWILHTKCSSAAHKPIGRGTSERPSRDAYPLMWSVDCDLFVYLHNLSDKVFEYLRVKLQQSDIFLLEFQYPWHRRSMREHTLRTDGATSHNPAHTALSACLSSSSSSVGTQ